MSARPSGGGARSKWEVRRPRSPMRRRSRRRRAVNRSPASGPHGCVVVARRRPDLLLDGAHQSAAGRTSEAARVAAQFLASPGGGGGPCAPPRPPRARAARDRDGAAPRSTRDLCAAVAFSGHLYASGKRLWGARLRSESGAILAATVARPASRGPRTVEPPTNRRHRRRSAAPAHLGETSDARVMVRPLVAAARGGGRRLRRTRPDGGVTTLEGRFGSDRHAA